MFTTIIWATDGSERADAALGLVKRLASESPGSSVFAVHCDEHFVGRAAGWPVLADEEDLRVKIHGQVEELKNDGIEAELRVPVSAGKHPAEMLAQVARELDECVIVVATRGHGPIGGALLGSVTQKLLHISPCPVLVVPPALSVPKQTPETAEVAH